jgi:hypothetical protein
LKKICKYVFTGGIGGYDAFNVLLYGMRGLHCIVLFEIQETAEVLLPELAGHDRAVDKRLEVAEDLLLYGKFASLVLGAHVPVLLVDNLPSGLVGGCFPTACWHISVVEAPLQSSSDSNMHGQLRDSLHCLVAVVPLGRTGESGIEELDEDDMNGVHSVHNAFITARTTLSRPV